MGEVYRAKDTRLNREVAIKVLPEAFASDPERLARFKREAHVLASLNHPHIGAIYGFEETANASALILELVEGPTLADRIAQGPIPLDEALPIAKQICEALEAAHEHGIIHRDLKPANIKLTPDGRVKVLDFGLAKAAETGASLREDLTASPTITSPTIGGVILGTAAYMSPEQARGKVVDKRSDIWSFACVLYEMLTGTPAFEDEDVSLTLSKVLQKEPDLARLAQTVPPRVRQLLSVSLRKDVTQRVADIRDVRLALDGAFESVIVQKNDARRSSRAWMAVALVFMAAAVAMAGIHFREEPAQQPTLHYEVLAPKSETIVTFAVSPDGRYLAFTTGRLGTTTGSNFNRLWVRSFDSMDARPLPNTEGAVGAFWSPDGRSIGFFANGKLRKINVSGGQPEVICEAPPQLSGAWNRNDIIVFSRGGPLYQVSAAGGEPKAVTTLDASRQEVIHTWPQFLPDDRHLLYTAGSSTEENRGVYVASLESADRTRLMVGGGNVRYAEDAVGQEQLLFLRQGTLVAQRFNARALSLEGSPFRVVDNLAVVPLTSVGSGLAGQFGQFSTSSRGLLSYQPVRLASSVIELVWFDRSGKRLGTVAEPGTYSNLALSPDEQRLAISRVDPRVGLRDIYILDLNRGGERIFTFDRGDDMNPIWDPRGERIAFSSSRTGRRGLYVKDATGVGQDQLLLDSGNAADWSHDGRYILGGGSILPLFGERKPIALPDGISSPRVSPDGRWLAYESNERGRLEIYVQSFSDILASRSAGKWQVSSAGGIYPEWRRDGRELFYVAPDNTLMSVPVKASGNVFQSEPVAPLFALRLEPASRRAHYQPAMNGQRFLVAQLPEQDASNPLRVLVNWTAASKE